MNRMFDLIDATGSGDKRDPRMRNVEAEMIRSHELCLKISSKKPTDPDYKRLLEELNKAYAYEVMPVDHPAGEYTLGIDGYVEFHMKENAGIEWILEHLYTLPE